LHGGWYGFSRKEWKSEQLEENKDGEQSVMFTLTSEDGDQKFPGAIDVKVLYTLKDNQLS